MTDFIVITLLTKKEYFRYKHIISLAGESWWLRSPDDCCSVYRVSGIGGQVYSNGCINDYSGVRPALYMSLVNQKSLKSGDNIRIGSRNFIVLSWEKDKLLALCDKCIDKQIFDAHSNQWSTSQLKQWLNTDGLKLIF